MAKFFVRPESVSNQRVTIIGADAHHISKVLRMKQGEMIRVADGSGCEYVSELYSISPEEVTALVRQVIPSNQEPPIDVYLFQGLPKGEKFDLIIQKCTEIGIKKIFPLSTQRSIVHLTPEKEEKRRERWQRIAAEAAKQSGRGLVPNVEPLMDLTEALKSLPPDAVVLMPWEGEETTGLKGVLKHLNTSGPIILVIGPEGGFSIEEAETARTLGAVTVSLGPRILRTETAGMAALSMLLYELGDLGGKDCD